MDEIIRKTKSVCPVCMRKVDASIVDRQGAIFFIKHCPEHNDTEVPLSRSGRYKDLERFYFSMRRKKDLKTVERPELIITSACNMDCPVCYLGDLRKEAIDCDPSFEEIENLVRNSDYKMFVLTGGEPTCRKDLPDIIAMLKKYKKAVVLNTNGIKLANRSYLETLRQAGLDRVNFQFSGFKEKAEKALRGGDYLSAKLEALRNLEEINMPTGLNTLISGGSNEQQIKQLLDYSIKNRSIKLLNLSAMIFIGYTKNLSRSAYLMPDDIFSLVEEQTQGMIKKDNIYLFKKLEITISSFFNKSTCFYNYSYLVVRKKFGYKPIDKYVDLKRVEPHLDRYQRIFLYYPLLARIYLAFAMPLILFFNVKFWSLPKEIYLRLFSYFFKRSSFLKPKQ